MVKQGNWKRIKGITGLVLVLTLLFSIMPLSVAENKVIIQDDVNLLTEAEQKKLMELMSPICKYCTPIFWTTNLDGDIATLTRDFCLENVGKNGAYVIFVIDMKVRRLGVFSSSYVFDIITTEKANQITNHTYRLASNGDFYDSAAEAFEEILYLLENSETEKADSLKNSEVLTSMTYDELCETRKAVDEEILSRPEWKEVTVQAGKYTVGEDFPDIDFATVLHSGESIGVIMLKDGMVLQLLGPVIITPPKPLEF